MSKLFICDVCGKETTELDSKSIVVTKRRNKDDFIATFGSKTDVLIRDVCPECLDTIRGIVNKDKEAMDKVVKALIPEARHDKEPIGSSYKKYYERKGESKC